MKKNIGKIDRLGRLLIAVLLLLYALWQLSFLAAAFGLFTLYEALAGWCIFYQLIGKNTCPVNKEK